MKRWEEKDPTDSVVVEFIFTDDAASVTSPVITVQASDPLLDPNPSTIISGGPSIDGAIVRQRIVNGVDGVDYFFKCVASTDNSDVLTIEAVLPVRLRPVPVAYVSRYLTADQFERRFGHEELTDLQEDGNTFGQCEIEAASLIDGFLATKYTLPLASVPGIVVGWAADITRYKLWDERAPEEVKERYTAALKQLELLAKGLIALPPDAAGTPAAAGLEFAGFSATRVFNEDTLRLF